MRLVEVVGYEADEARISHFYKWERFNACMPERGFVISGEAIREWIEDKAREA